MLRSVSTGHRVAILLHQQPTLAIHLKRQLGSSVTLFCGINNLQQAIPFRRQLALSTINMGTRKSSRIGKKSLIPLSPGLPNVVRSRKRKATEEVDDSNGNEGNQDPTSLPKKSEESASTPKKPKVLVLPPETPTPAAAASMAIPYSSGDLNDGPPPAAKNRFADPFSTNATLVSPATSRLISNKPADSTSPSKLASSKFKTTTSNILDEACAHLLKIEPKLKPVIEAHRCHLFTPEGLAEEIDPFRSLASGIIAQQVSGAAATAIMNRFVALFHPPDTPSPTWPTPAQVAEKDITTLRTAGLSQRKAEYIQGLAQKFASGELTTEMLFDADYEEVFEKLIAVRGLGKWSVEMFACFGLKRMDVFSTGDLGVQRGMAALMGKNVSKLKSGGGGKFKYMSEKEMLEMSEKFAPYRSLFMWYMWRVEDVDISALEQ